MVEESLTKFKSDFLTEIAETFSSSIKKVCESEITNALEEKPKVRRKSNQAQYDFNLKIKRVFENTENAVKTGNTEVAKTSISQGMKLIKERQKHIKIADREDCSWQVIEHYKSDVLAEDSEDEKRIARARRIAQADKKGKRERKGKERKKRKGTRTRNMIITIGIRHDIQTKDIIL